jgi:hypothetical protein
MDDFVGISVSVDSKSQLYVTWADFRNGQPNCKGVAAAATPPCDNDVLFVFGQSRCDLEQRDKTDARWERPMDAVEWGHGGRLRIVGRYYDRSYGTCEQTGCNDITLAKVAHPTSNTPTISHRRATTSSMPNLTAANNPVQAGFLGDYMWLKVDARGRPNVVWADTRGLNGAIEEDIYFSRVSVDRDD